MNISSISRHWKLECCWIVTVNNVDCCHYFILEQITVDALIRPAEPCLLFKAFGITTRKTKQNEVNREKKKEMKNNSSKIKFTKDLWIYVYYISKWWRRMWENLSKKSKSDWLRFSCTRWCRTVNKSKMNRNHIEKYNKQQEPKMRITSTSRYHAKNAQGKTVKSTTEHWTRENRTKPSEYLLFYFYYYFLGSIAAAAAAGGG